jgi:hypothetical protein
MIITRRSFLTGLVAAPLIVRPGLLMPVRKLIEPQPAYLWKVSLDYDPRASHYKMMPPLLVSLRIDGTPRKIDILYAQKGRAAGRLD